MAVFDGVRYSLSPSLPPTRRRELAAILDLNGAAPQPPYTHLIALPASHAHSNATNDPTIKLVTDRWVDRSIVMGKCQPEQNYSPDPAMIFSGVVACATDLSVTDLEVLSAGITALGGQWRIGLTRDVTHLFALRTGSDKYNTALHFATQTHMYIITPHWFDDSVRLGRRIPEISYAWPDPPVLRPGMTLNLEADPLATEGRRRRKPAGDTDAETGNGTNVLNEGEHVHIWAGRRILLSASLELGNGSRSAIEAGIQRAGGVVVPITENTDEDVEEKAVDECDVLITRWRSGKSYFKAARASLLIGTLSWLFSVDSSGTLHSPLDSLLWYPTPRGGIPDLINCEISITNYTGAARDYIKRLIVLVGAKFTPSMSQSNKVLVAGFQPSPKTTRALSWSIPVVNHTWLEDCFVEWRALTVGLERYILYPPGIDFGKMLMTRQDGSPSQSMSTARPSGGAVPGGRGIGIVDVEQEELRDTEFCARARSGAGALDLLTMQEALANDATMDGLSTFQPEGEMPTESRPQAPSQAGSVKTPSSSLRVKRGLISTPLTASATGAFVDHMIRLPADDDEDGDIGGKRRTLPNYEQRAQALLVGSRATSRSLSKPPSVGLSGTIKEVKAADRDVGGSSKVEKEKGKGKERSGVDDTGKPQTRPPQEAEEDEDAPQPARPPKHKPYLVERKSVLQAEETTDEVEKQPPAQRNKLRRRAKGMTIGSDSGSDSDASEGEGSVPPRRATGVSSTTPVKSGMKPRPRSMPKSRSGPKSVLDGSSGDKVKVLAGTVAGTSKQREDVEGPRRNDEVITKVKEEEKTKEGRKGTEKVTPRPRSPTGSPLSASPDAKNSRTPKRRLSVLVPSVPKNYFSSPSVGRAINADGEGDQEYESEKKGAAASTTSGPRHKPLAPAASMRAVAAEVSTSTSKRSKPSPAKISAPFTASGKLGRQPKAKAKSMPSASKEMTKTRVDDNDQDMNKEGEDSDRAVIVGIPMTSTSRGGQRRSAANKATTRLREEIMPDVISFEREQKQTKRRRSVGGLSVASLGGANEEREGREERAGKRRKVATQAKEEEEEEAEVEDVVLVSSMETIPKPTNGKSKSKGTTAVGSDEDMNKWPAKNRPGESHEKKGARGRGEGSAAIRLITTGVTLLDDIIKRLAKLGVQMTTKPTDCTHLIAKGIVRTEKFLCAMSVSPYVLTEEWANVSAKGGKLLPENDYLLSDAAAERKWAFSFVDAMARAKGPEGGSSLFKQMTFYVTPKVSVDTKLLRNVVSAGGGQVQTSTMPTARILKGKANRYVVSCPEDKAVWRPLVQEGFKIFSPELVLRGALRQEIEWEKEECLVAG